MEKKKVLIIARDFLPYSFSFGGAVRVLKLAEYLDENGVEAFVLTARGEPISYFGYEDLVRRLNVTYMKDRLQPLLNRITDSASRSRLQKIQKSSRAFGVLKKIANELSVPDIGVFFVGKFIRQAARMIRRHDIRNVLVTSPPPSMLLVGYAMKIIFKERIAFFVDYRDSWDIGYVGGKKIPLLNRINNGLEKRILEKADVFLHVSEPMLTRLTPRIAGLPSKSVLVMNGYDAKQIGAAATVGAGRECMRIGHFGRLRGNEVHRNPERLFAAVEKLEGRVRLILFGDVSIPEHEKRRLEKIAEFRGVVPHEESVRAMREMDLLLLYHSEREGAKEVVTGKLFEYMLAQRPILVMGPPDMEAAEIVRKEGIGYTVDLFDAQAVDSVFRDLLKEWSESRLIRYDIGTLRRYSRQHQYSKILGHLAPS